MKCECGKCAGDGSTECEHCGCCKDCAVCGGTGTVEECISTVPISKRWKNFEQIELLQVDARKCRADHAKLVTLNPRAKTSYDRQLAETLRKIDSEAEALRDL